MTAGFPHRGNFFSIVWKNRENFFHCVENCYDNPPYSLNPFSLSP